MSYLSNFNEYNDSQLPAINLLCKLGFKYLDEDQVLAARGNNLSNVILDGILLDQLQKINSFKYKSQTRTFSDSNIKGALKAIKEVPSGSIVQSNQYAYDLLTLGKSFRENLGIDQKSFTIKYIDWKNPENNVYHVTKEFKVQGPKRNCRPDIVLFVNGIPFVVIENKRADKIGSSSAAVQQLKSYQDPIMGIPRLFYYAQLLLAMQPNEVKYGVTGTPAEYFMKWKTDGLRDQVQKIIQTAANGMPEEFRAPMEQDLSIYALCEPKKLLELVYLYTLFDGPIKKITRYTQYRAVQKTLLRIHERNEKGNRKGGVVWHTQGSGKSLTQVLIAKALSLSDSVKNPRVLIVTDRISLDHQIRDVFRNCDKDPKQAKSGTHLYELLRSKGADVITTVINKFEAANRLAQKDKITDENLFVLVDESHRTQYGSMHSAMRLLLPNACFIGFTGTPLMKLDRKTVNQFGGYIDQYKIDEAEKDKVVLQILYESRVPEINLDGEPIEKMFQKLIEGKPKEIKELLKKEGTRLSRVLQSEQVIEAIADDVKSHFIKNVRNASFDDRHFKAQLVVPTRKAAYQYWKAITSSLGEENPINARIVISDMNPFTDHQEKEWTPLAKKYWKKFVVPYFFNDEERYKRDVRERFARADDNSIELLIVVDMLLTGYDAPPNKVLYISKYIADYSLLQAIARVNRQSPGKDFGYVVDYIGILKVLDEAMEKYSGVFAGFDQEEIHGLVNIKQQLEELKIAHSKLISFFSKDKLKDKEALQEELRNEDRRDEFYDTLSNFGKTFRIVEANGLYMEIDEDLYNKYKATWSYYKSLRDQVRMRYSDTNNIDEYEKQIDKYLDRYVISTDVQTIIQPINVSDPAIRKGEILKTPGNAAAKADHIHSQLVKRAYEEVREQDPTFYESFRERLKKTIDDYLESRNEEQYLDQVIQCKDQYFDRNKVGVDLSTNLIPLFRKLDEITTKKEVETSKEELAEITKALGEILEKRVIRDWKKNDDVKKDMMNDVEDYLLLEKADVFDIDTVTEDFLQKIIDTFQNNQ